MRVLITAGPTCVNLDAVRILTSRFSGNTGIRIAKHFVDHRNVKVRLLLAAGFGQEKVPDLANLECVRIQTFDELRNAFYESLKELQPEMVIASAAVSDYRPVEPVAFKVASGQQQWQIVLRPTEKLVDQVKRYSPGTFLVKFKLESGVKVDRLLAIGRRALRQSNADCVVLNTLESYAGPGPRGLHLLLASGQVIDIDDRDKLPRSLWELYQSHGARRRP